MQWARREKLKLNSRNPTPERSIRIFAVGAKNFQGCPGGQLGAHLLIQVIQRCQSAGYGGLLWSGLSALDFPSTNRRLRKQIDQLTRAERSVFHHRARDGGLTADWEFCRATVILASTGFFRTKPTFASSGLLQFPRVKGNISC